MVGFSSRLPEAMEAVRVIGAGTGGAPGCHLIFASVSHLAQGIATKSGLRQEGPQPASPWWTAAFPGNPFHTKSEQLLPWEGTTHPGAIKPEAGQISAGSMFPYTAQSWLHRNPLYCTCKGPGVQRIGGHTKAFLAALRTPFPSALAWMPPSRLIRHIFKYPFLFAGRS